MKYPRTVVAALMVAYLFTASGCKCGKKAEAAPETPVAVEAPVEVQIEQAGVWIPPEDSK